MYLTGVLQALGIVVVTTLFNVYIRVNSLLFDIEPIVFSCIYLIATALTLSLVAGPGRFVNDTLKTPATWLYGFVLIGTFIVDIYLVKFISGTEVSILSRISVPISMLLALLFLKRNPVKTDIFNIIALTISLVVVFLLQDGKSLFPILILGFLSALLQAIVFMFSETHKQSVTAQQVGNLRDRARVVGFVTFITSMIFLVFALSISLIKAHLLSSGLQQQLTYIPDMNRFMHAPTIWSGFIFGLLLSPFLRYFQWSATYKIKTENVLTVLAIIPLTTLICEWALSHHSLFASNSSSFTGERGVILFSITILMASGAWYSAYLRLTKHMDIVSWSAFKKNLNKSIKVQRENLTIQHSATAMDDYEIVYSTLEHTHGNEIKAAELLNITTDTLHVLHEGKGSLALVSHASQEVSRRYRNQVANRDTLTGILNRGGFMAEAKKLLEKSEQGNQQASLLFIDLDKFKPVNDTYGHDAGDFILKGVAERLLKITPQGGLVTRLGGDEFCILLVDSDKKSAKKQAKLISKKIAKPFNFKGEKIIIGVSVGIANYTEDGSTTEELLKHADEGMYDEKKG